MKIFKFIILFVILISIGCTNGGTEIANTDLDSNLSSEEIIEEKEPDKTSIEDIELTEKINIYLFWGDGCPVCERLINYFDSIENEYGKLYNLVKYEIWYNEDNQKLFQDVSAQLNQNVHAIPYMVIGDTSIVGYSSIKDEYIKETIIEQYLAEERVDLVKNLED